MTKREVILAERAFLVDTLRGLQARQWQAETLCAGWTIEDLAAHLLVRERGGILARSGIVLPFLHHRHDAAIVKMKHNSHEELLRRLEKPPAWIPLLSFNVIEFYVHNEDVLRGGLQRTRKLSDELESALSDFVPVLSKLAFRRVVGSFRLVMHDTVADQIHEQVIGRGAATELPELRLEGPPGEFIMLFMGRGRQARLKQEGDRSAREIYKVADIGL